MNSSDKCTLSLHNLDLKSEGHAHKTYFNETFNLTLKFTGDTKPLI